MAIRMGKHVYCQKPLTQTVYEARLLRRLAKEYKVATQMGNQGSAEDGLRRAVEVIQAGLLGTVRQVARDRRLMDDAALNKALDARRMTSPQADMIGSGGA